MKAELDARRERSLDGDRTPATSAADVTRRRTVLGVTVADETDRLCGLTVSVDDDDDPAVVDSNDDTGTVVGGEGGATPPLLLPSLATPDDAGTTATTFVWF